MTAEPVVLIIGAGADNLQHEGELNAALVKVAQALKKSGYQTHLIDNNPFNVAPELPAVIDHYSVAAPTVANLTRAIEQLQPAALLPTLGGRAALQVTERLATSGILNKYGVKIMGMPVATIRQVNNPSVLNQTLKQIGATTKKIAPVTTYADARDLVDEIGFPVVVRSVVPQAGSLRRIVHDYHELQLAVSTAIQHSPSHQAMVQQSLAGLKEIEVVVARDQSGMMMQLAMVEDLDPIGIHAGDSVAVLPTQTLLDRQIQDMRDVAFKITRKLRVVGINHVQFALNQLTGQFYVIKNSPYFDRLATFVEQATAYPVARVYGHLVAGKLLRDIRLDHGLAKHTAAMEPVLDRTAIRLPVFANDQLGVQNKELTTEKQSVGSVLGLGRSLLEALLKALGELHPDFYALANLGDEELDQLLIHPRPNRLLPVFEAIRRGYLTSELSELTKLDQYYLDQFKRLIELENRLLQAPKDRAALTAAKYWGFSDRLIGQLWQCSVTELRALRQEWQIHRTFKEVDPSAGELAQHPGTYYATFEMENESQPVAKPRVLLLGAGPRTLGNGVANDYLLTRVAAEFKRQGYAVVVVEDNPNSALLNRAVATKCYLEPRDYERVAAIMALERPDYLVSLACPFTAELPLVKAGTTRALALPPASLTAPVAHEVRYQYNVFFDGHYTYPLGITRLLLTPAGIKTEFAPDLPAGLGQTLTQAGEAAVSPELAPGLYQVEGQLIDGQLAIQPIHQPSPWMLVFLSQVTGLDLAAVWVRLALQKFSGRLLTAAMQGQRRQATRLEALFPYAALHLNRSTRLSEMMGARLEIE